jgi:hypothetical protein
LAISHQKLLVVLPLKIAPKEGFFIGSVSTMTMRAAIFKRMFDGALSNNWQSCPVGSAFVLTHGVKRGKRTCP